MSVASSIARALLASSLLSASAHAQAPAAGRLGDSTPPVPAAAGAAAREVRTVRGRVVRPDPRGERPVAGVRVVLHQVARTGSGPRDSVVTGADGMYGFRYEAAATDHGHEGEDEAVHFVSASYGGIAYFGTPLRAARVEGDDAILTVFDTTSGPLPLHVRGRHLVVSASSTEARRTVVEVFELSNDTTLTRIGGLRDSVTFAVSIPAGARDFAGGEGDVAAGAMALVDGRVEVYAPFAPGVKQLSFTYTLPYEAFPLSVPVERPVEVLEVLVEDSAAIVQGARLVAQGAVTTQGRTFTRWLADTVPAGAVVRVSLPVAGGGLGGDGRFPVLAIMGALGLTALTLGVLRVNARRRGLYDGPAVATHGPDPEHLARRIAALDATFERRRAPDDATRAAYAAERDRLKRELTDALARREGQG